MQQGQQPAAGWYVVGENERFWDGAAWTDHVRPAAQIPMPPPSVDAHGFAHASYGPPPVPGQAVPPSAPPPASHTPPPAYGYAMPMHTGLVSTPYGYVAPKNPAVSVLASFFLPGLGSILNGDVAKGIAIMVAYFVSWVLVIILIGIVGVFGFWVWGMVDAYNGARIWNARHGIHS